MSPFAIIPALAFFVFFLHAFPADSALLLSGNSTISSRNRTFQLRFFSPDEDSKNWYLGIRYASIPTPTFVWVANRETPFANLPSAALQITPTGQLAIVIDTHSSRNSTIWQTANTQKAAAIRLQESGNLVLLSHSGVVIWQSFDFPTDTWLPGMNISDGKSFTSWRSFNDPSPGMFSLRLSPSGYNEFELVYNNSVRYWSTGNWTGSAFSGVPEMTIPYIYNFHFADPSTPSASFWYTEMALDGALGPPLTRFKVEIGGQLKQYTWAQQIGSWNMFWSQPDNQCRVYGLCGDLGVCNGSSSINPCACVSGFSPVKGSNWNSGDYSGGCGREDGESLCAASDGFKKVGVARFDGLITVSFQGSRSACEETCLRNCSCRGLFHDDKTNSCKNLYGSFLNLRYFTSDSSSYQDVLYVRVPKEGIERKDGWWSKNVAWIGGTVVSFLVLGLVVVWMLVILTKRRKMRRGSMEEDGAFPVLNLKVFSYKELYAVTRGFSDKLGHGGFGGVFHGQLVDSSLVAVKRLERPGNGEKEFRAEVCTIGNIQHINLVRLRGFCSENSHRLLVYDYMPRGPLSAYLRRNGPNLSWDVRFRVAVGTARGIAYLHEGCRDCIMHCDIKPENILLDSDDTAKISDFGLARLVGRDFSRVLATMRGTWGYVAPEWISGVAITTKADVYSYGMTLLELLGGRRNVEAPPSAGDTSGGIEVERGEKWFFPPYAAQQIIEGNVAVVVDDRLGDAYDIEEAKRVALVAIWCIQDSEEMRPAMGMVVKMLEGVVEVTTPPPPKLLQALVSGESYRGVHMDSSSNGMSVSGDNEGAYSYGSQFSSAKHSTNKTRVLPQNHNQKLHFFCSLLNITLQNRVQTQAGKIGNNKENEESRAGEERSSSSSSSSSSSDGFSSSQRQPTTSHSAASPLIGGDVTRSDSLKYNGITVFETADLHPAPSTLVAAEGGDYPPPQTFEDVKIICILESSKLWAIAGPIAFNILCNYGVNSFTNIFAGHIGDMQLSAVAISLSVIANFAFGFLLGMGSALETLCGQAFGAGQIEMLGVYMQRSWIILFGACLCMLPLYIYATPILKLLGQEPDIAELAGRFAIQVIPQMFSLAINFPTQKFLQAQSKVGIMAWIGLMVLIAHIGILHLFINVFKWGLTGAALAYDISAWLISLAQVAYVVGWCKDGWRGLSLLAFKDLWGFTKLSIASAIMLSLELWYFMSIIVLTGHLEDPVIAVGSLSICMNINGWEGMLFIGINAAISVRVSNELGSGHPRACKYAVIMVCVQSLLIGISCAVTILATRNYFAIIFTDSEEMREAVANLAYLLGITMILNSVQPVISGVAVGGGWQGMVAYINLFSYYAIGLPLGFLLGYKTSLGVKGIWLGMIFGTFLQTLILVFIVYKTNWQKEVEQARERMKKWGAAIEDTQLPTHSVQKS